MAAVVSRSNVEGRPFTIIPDHKLMFIPLENEEEALYVAGVLNSSLIRLIVGAYTIETAMGTHIVDNVKMPKFDKTKSLHLRISHLSKNAHDLSTGKLKDIEEELDQRIADLYGLTEEELLNVKESLKLISFVSESEDAEEDVEEE